MSRLSVNVPPVASCRAHCTTSTASLPYAPHQVKPPLRQAVEPHHKATLPSQCAVVVVCEGNRTYREAGPEFEPERTDREAATEVVAVMGLNGQGRYSLSKAYSRGDHVIWLVAPLLWSPHGIEARTGVKGLPKRSQHLPHGSKFLKPVLMPARVRVRRSERME